MESYAQHLPLISAVASTVVMGLIGLGLLLRRQARRHMPVMLACFLIDVANVLVIELNQNAIQQSMETATEAGNLLLKVHIVASLAAVVCYLIAIVSGVRLYRRGVGRSFHQRNAMAFLAARTVNYVTSFYFLV